MLGAEESQLALDWTTPAAWVPCALTEPLSLLNDHAHLERKAASNALELINRWPYPVHVDAARPDTDVWSRTLAAIARDEVKHLGQVLTVLQKRGGHFERSHVNPYARGLRGLVRTGLGRGELLDRLLVSALIEARSYERFALLSTHADDEELRMLYGRLRESERGHYRQFLALARLLPEARSVMRSRWLELRTREAQIIQSMPPGPSMHSGPPSSESTP